MIIVVKADGSTFVTAANLGYGSTVHEVSIIAPFTNGTMTIAFDLPSGTLLEPKLCTPAAATGEDFGVWTIAMTADITAEAGTVGYQIGITDQYGTIFTTERGTTTVTGGISTILPAQPSASTYTDILEVLSAINTNQQTNYAAITALIESLGASTDEASATGTAYARIAKAVADIATNAAAIAALDAAKVDKVTGKGLSTNDYTTAEKNALAGMVDTIAGHEANAAQYAVNALGAATAANVSAVNAADSAEDAAGSATDALNNKLNGIETHNADEAAHGFILGEIATLDALARGKNAGLVFDTEAHLDAWIAGTYTRTDEIVVADINIGDNLYVVEVDKPDYWWDGTQKQVLEANNVNFEDFYSKTEVDALLPIHKTRAEYEALDPEDIIAGRTYEVIEAS